MNAIRTVQQEMEAAKLITAQVAALAGNDPEFIQDTIEGETGLHEAIRALVASIGEDEAHSDGLATYIRQLQDRRARIEARVDLKRALIASGLEVADKRKMETDVGTVSLVAIHPRAEVSEEADVPAEFWRPQPPKLDKRSLLAALKEGQSIPGARLTNGGVTVQIRA